MDDCFDEDMHDQFDDDWGDGAGSENAPADSNDGCLDGLDWQDWMTIGPLSEDIAREKREIDRIRREQDDADDDYWEWLNQKL